MNERRSQAMRGNGNAVKSNHWALKSRLEERGFAALSEEMRARVQEWRNAIVEDLGGNDNLSELQQDLVDRYLHTSVLINSLNDWLSKQMTKPRKNGTHALINQRQRTVYPILLERNRIIETSLKIASALGLERQEAKEVDTLERKKLEYAEKRVQELESVLVAEKSQESESSQRETAL